MKAKQVVMAAVVGAVPVVAQASVGVTDLEAQPVVRGQDFVLDGVGLYRIAAQHVLGTSMEMILETPSASLAAEVERRVMSEISRLSSILSTYDETSEITGVMAGTREIESKELAEVLGLYETWSQRTGGVVDVNLGEVKKLWTRGQRPSREALETAYGIERGWNVDALGKAYVVDRAVAVAREVVPSGLINIGGDLRAWGSRAFEVGVADPNNFSESTCGLGTFILRDGAVASSGGYLRNFEVDGETLSHLIDGRTLTPARADGPAVTVVAGSCVTANALSTAASVMDAPEADAMLAKYGDGHVTVRDGVYVTAGAVNLQAGPSTKPGAPATQPSGGVWPSGYQVSIGINLQAAAGGGPGGPGGGPGGGGPGGPGGKPPPKPHKPFVAVWIEDANGKLVKNIAFWAAPKEEKYFPEMTAWWTAIKQNKELARTLASGSKPAGLAVATWDGTDDSGKPVKQGTYRVRIEINREHGTHVRPSVSITCRDKAASVVLKGTTETADSKIEYGPVKPSEPAK